MQTSHPHSTPAGPMAMNDFWYSRSAVAAFLCALFLLVSSLSFLIPPFQSPDEFNHVARAYVLSKGTIALASEKNIPSGGKVDDGLIAYMKFFEGFPFHADKKVANPELLLSSSVEWSGTESFVAFPNTALYFPLPYAPQAMAFRAGETFGLSVHDSYRLARTFSLLATLALLGCAFLLYPAPLFVAALFLLPMSLFQLGSASLDSVTFGICVLSAALFMRGTDKDYAFTKPMLWTLLLGLFALATSRMNLVVLTVLPLAICLVRKTRGCVAATAGLAAASLGWILFSLVSVQGMFPQKPSTPELLQHYLSNPGALFSVLHATFTDGALLKDLWNMFVGRLGWLDTPLDSSTYRLFGLLFVPLALVCFQRDKARLLRVGNLSLASGAIVATFLLYFLILVCLPHPLKAIHGVQGRYFIPVLVCLGYAVFGRKLVGAELKAGLALTFCLALLSVTSMAPKLLNRYWLNETASSYYDYNKRPDDYSLKPSAALETGKTLPISMTGSHMADPSALKRIGIRFKTHGAEAQGQAELRLKGPGGAECVRRFSLSDVADGKYRSFALDPGLYTSGELLSTDGGGVSIWESRGGVDGAKACLIYEYANGNTRFTPGCPLH